MVFNRLLPENFTFGNYGYHIPLDVYFNKSAFLEFIKNSEIVGISKYPSFREREGTYAVLFADEDFNERWTHVPDFIIEEVESEE